MKLRALLILTLLTVFTLGAEAKSGVGVQSFKSWKSRRVTEAQALADNLNRELVMASRAGDTTEQNRIKSRLTQAKVNLGVVKELTANDYFVLYLMVQFKNNIAAFSLAAKSLSPQDMSEILDAYRKQMISLSKAPPEQVGAAFDSNL
jgi:hypothetical protein